MKNSTMQIAQTILNQIKYLDRSALMAWGAQSFCALSENEVRAGGLSFRVNGITHKGWVTIELDWLDTYNVIFTNRNRNVVKSFEGVYCDQLVDIIDYIEGKHAA
ncbi:hypothetical protein FJ651_14060 [Paucihalobacter ruber]|uniref:Uncharacterized protein n=1 Tax=Paucihalobacter ruber TaxID=2567861 RepID=A0A506PEF6_9FLAO|nr:hypothetical protein [Paucihalobacter ruber]TPV31934.1 hypothetical protein FJ651_14060 [Paucihalobacter ruber]